MEEEIEVWKECGESKRCFYKISNLGRVKSITKGKKGGKERILKGSNDSHGYLFVKIGKSITIHTLVAYAFIGERPEGSQIDHKDRNKLNNKADNLRYATQSENQQNTSRYRIDILETEPKERLKIRSKLNAKKYRDKQKNI